MINVDFLFGVVTGAALAGLIGFFLRVKQQAESDVDSMLGETSTWDVVTNDVSKIDPAPSSNTVLTIVPTLVSVPRQLTSTTSVPVAKNPSPEPSQQSRDAYDHVDDDFRLLVERAAKKTPKKTPKSVKKSPRANAKKRR
jgi:hypothetical protein